MFYLSLWQFKNNLRKVFAGSSMNSIVSGMDSPCCLYYASFFVWGLLSVFWNFGVWAFCVWEDLCFCGLCSYSLSLLSSLPGVWLSPARSSLCLQQKWGGSAVMLGVLQSQSQWGARFDFDPFSASFCERRERRSPFCLHQQWFWRRSVIPFVPLGLTWDALPASRHRAPSLLLRNLHHLVFLLFSAFISASLVFELTMLLWFCLEH